MAGKALRQCAQPGCAELQHEARCPKHAKDTRPQPNERGYDSDWQELRNEHLATNPYCEECGKDGSIVHHIIPVKNATHLRLEPSNLVTLCRSCHRKVHNERNDNS